MNGKENKKAPEELADEALDAIAGGAGGPGPSFANSTGSVRCCGEILRVPADSLVTCPKCGKIWKGGPGLV